MRDFEDLFWALAKLVNLALDAHFLNRIFYALNVYHSLVSEGMKEVKSFNSFLASLFVAKNQINPFMEIVRDEFRLQGSSIDLQIGFRVSISPKRNPNISNFLFILSDSKIEILIILQE
jgi:hypothetical protein